MKCASGHRLRYLEPLQTWTHPDATSWCSAGYEPNDKDGDPGMTPIPTNPDGKPAGAKPPNPPTSASGVSGEPVGPYAPTRTTNDAPLREWLAEQFGVLPTHRWMDDRFVNQLANRIDALVDVVLRQENRLTEHLSLISKKIDFLNQLDESDGGEPLVTQGHALAEYDRGVADGRASISNLASGAAYQRGLADGRDAQARDNPNEVTLTLAGYSAAKQAEFEHGLNIGKAEREAELLEQGWTPPGTESADIRVDAAYLRGQKMGMEVAHAHGEGGPTDDDLWETALTIAGSQRNRRELEHARVREDAVWFYQELKAGPDNAVPWLQVSKFTDPADQAQETRAAANPADLIDGDVDHTQDPNDPTSAY